MTSNRPNLNQAQKPYVELIHNLLLASFKSLSGGICHWELRGDISDGETAHWVRRNMTPHAPYTHRHPMERGVEGKRF